MLIFLFLKTASFSWLYFLNKVFMPLIVFLLKHGNKTCNIFIFMNFLRKKFIWKICATSSILLNISF